MAGNNNGRLTNAIGESLSPAAIKLTVPTEVFGSERLTGPLLDRLTHHVHILEMNGDSYRLNQSRRRQTPTANRTDHPAHA